MLAKCIHFAILTITSLLVIIIFFKILNFSTTDAPSTDANRQKAIENPHTWGGIHRKRNQRSASSTACEWFRRSRRPLQRLGPTPQAAQIPPSAHDAGIYAILARVGARDAGRFPP